MCVGVRCFVVIPVTFSEDLSCHPLQQNAVSRCHDGVFVCYVWFWVPRESWFYVRFVLILARDRFQLDLSRPSTPRWCVLPPRGGLRERLVRAAPPDLTSLAPPNGWNKAGRCAILGNIVRYCAILFDI